MTLQDDGTYYLQVMVYNDAKVLSFTVGYVVFEADASAPYDQYFEKDGSARYEFNYSFT